ncbi:MAG: 3-hydroxyacyl-ACP dehydratase FabZ family protein [Candidatus Anammoxibacter sp.]
MRFFLFDRIIEFEKNKRCVGEKCVSRSEDFFTKHYDRYPVMPESLILEAIGQVGSWATAASIDFEAVSLLLSVENFKCYKPVFPGDVLRLEVEISSNNDFGSQISGIAKNGETVVAEVERIVFWSYKYDGFSQEFEKKFNLYRSGDTAFLDNAWYKTL